MPISEVTTGHGSQLHLNPSGVLTKVAEVDDIPELPSFTTTLYEVSSFDTEEAKEFKKQPLKEGVEYTIAGNFVLGSTSTTLLDAAEANNEPIPYEIHLPQGEDTYVVSGTALFYNLKYLNVANEKRKFNITMKPTSKAAREKETP
jgi:hypothetical protein